MNFFNNFEIDFSLVENPIKYHAFYILSISRV